MSFTIFGRFERQRAAAKGYKRPGRGNGPSPNKGSVTVSPGVPVANPTGAIITPQGIVIPKSMLSSIPLVSRNPEGACSEVSLKFFMWSRTFLDQLFM